MLEAQRTALSKVEDASLCPQPLEDVEVPLDSAREKVTSVGAASDEAAARSKGELTRLQKDFD